MAVQVSAVVEEVNIHLVVLSIVLAHIEGSQCVLRSEVLDRQVDGVTELDVNDGHSVYLLYFDLEFRQAFS